MSLRRLIFGLVISWPATLWAGKAIPPSPTAYVYNEGVVSSGEEAKLYTTLRGYEQSTGHQFTIALFQSLDGEELEDYSNRVFRAWKVGSSKLNDGLLFCLYKQDRKWRVEVGYGLEGTLTDLQAGAVARDQGVPYFKSNDFDSGVQTVAEALIAKVSGRPVPRASRDGRYDDYPMATILFFCLFVFIMVMQYVKYQAHRIVYDHIHIGRKPRDTFWEDASSGGSWFGGGGGFSGGDSFGGFSGGGGSSGGGGASGGW